MDELFKMYPHGFRFEDLNEKYFERAKLAARSSQQAKNRDGKQRQSRTCNCRKEARHGNRS